MIPDDLKQLGDEVALNCAIKFIEQGVMLAPLPGNKPKVVLEIMTEELSPLLQRLAAAQKCVEALERVWEEAECKWIYVEGSPNVGCGKCNGEAPSRNEIQHEDYCTQGFIHEALTAWDGANKKEANE